MGLDAGLRKALLGARMHGKDDRNLGSDGINGAEEFGEFFGGVDVGRTMKSEDAEGVPFGAVLKAKIIADRRLLGDGKKMAERIDHHVAHEIDGVAGTAFFEEMLDGVFFSDEEKVSEGVGEDAVNFFGHGTIEAAKAGFDVGYGNAKFHRSQRNGNGGIDVANHEYKVRLMFYQDGLNALENLGGLNGVSAGADFKIEVWRGNTHLAEENIGKGRVVVLAGVNEDRLDFGVALHFAH